MPNNQDALKLLPCGWSIKDYGRDGWHITTPEGVGLDIGFNAEGAAQFAAAMNTPTPREQELEAQNKALWELVLQAECAFGKNDEWLRASLSEPDDSDRTRSMKLALEAGELCADAMAAIKKAKETR